MDADLSRRAAAAMNTPLFFTMTFVQRQEFVEACAKVQTFDQLEKAWQDKVLEAERAAK